MRATANDGRAAENMVYILLCRGAILLATRSLAFAEAQRERMQRNHASRITLVTKVLS